MITRLLVALIAIIAPVCAETFAYQKETSLSGAAEIVTIHLPAGASRTVRFDGASVYCSVACTFTLEMNGSVPTTTAASATVELGNRSRTAVAVPYHTSNSTGGVVIKTYNVAAGAESRIELVDMGLTAKTSLTIRTSSITGTARIFVKWKE